jgi:replicative DNA helicase
MKLFSAMSEMKAIRTICEAKQSISGLVLASLDDKSFHYPPAREAYRRILGIVRNTGNVPDYAEICSDPTIGEDSRKLLLKSDHEAIHSSSKAQSLLRALNKYRQLRGIVRIAENSIKSLEADSVDPDVVLDEMSDALAEVRSRVHANRSMIHLGKGNNAGALVKKILSGDKPNLIPTGFKAYDDVNGGIPDGLFVMAATTSGGKSTMVGNLLKNTALKACENSINVSLEMSDEETLSRDLAQQSGIDMKKFSLKKFADGERKQVKKAYKRMVKTLKGSDTRYTIFSPDEDLTIEELLFLLKPYGYKVIAIDYISLLKGSDGDDQWKQLSRIARFCKVFARVHKVVIVLLAQLSEAGDVRYAKAIKEHANNMWTWVMTEEARDTGIIEVKQPKARNQEPHTFYLKIEFDKMLVRDLTEEEKETMGSMSSRSEGEDPGDQEAPARTNGKKGRNGKREEKKDDEYLEDVS